MHILRLTCLCFRLEEHIPLVYLIQGQLVQLNYSIPINSWSGLY